MRIARGHGRALFLAIASIALVSACSSSAASPSAGAASPAASSVAGISVTGAWIRNSTAATSTLAGYLVITNNGTAADTLLKVASPIARTVQMHETVSVPAMPSASAMGGSGSAMPSAVPSASGMGAMSSAAPSGSAMSGMSPAMPAASGMGGMMTMVEVPRVEVPAGATVEFKPGGYHIMFRDLIGTLTTGQTVDLTLTFANAGPITVKAEVRAE